MDIVVNNAADAKGEYLRLRDDAGFAWSEDAFFLRMLDAYYSAVFDGKQRVLSAAAIEGGKAIAAIDANLTNGIVAFHGRPAEMGIAGGADASQIERAVKLLCGHLVQEGKATGASHVLLRDQANAGTLSPLAQECLRLGGEPEAEIRAIVDLSQSDAALRTDLRKRYRGYINWGEKNLVTCFINGENPGAADYDQYREFHHRVAGRVTRPAASWDQMYELIAGGKGELLLGLLDDQLVAATITTYSGVTATYASGVYERSLFEKPLAHWPMFLSMLRARQAGMRFYDVGEIPQASRVTPKEFSIGYFKRGFTSRLRQQTLWRIALNRAAQASPPEADTEASSTSMSAVEHAI